MGNDKINEHIEIYSNVFIKKGTMCDLIDSETLFKLESEYYYGGDTQKYFNEIMETKGDLIYSFLRSYNYACGKGVAEILEKVFPSADNSMVLKIIEYANKHLNSKEIDVAIKKVKNKTDQEILDG